MGSATHSHPQPHPHPHPRPRPHPPTPPLPLCALKGTITLILILILILILTPPRTHSHSHSFKGTLYDVTHLPCRSARYTPAEGGTCTPAQANPKDFPVRRTTQSLAPAGPKHDANLNPTRILPPTPTANLALITQVKPGAVMPGVNGCKGVDYAVLFVIGEEV